ncbi:MAG: MFS transporter [Nannocystaceae bacterium]|nr:MFS transporter [Nannocystaceae bacterium]
MGAAVRLAIGFCAVFFLLGVFMPFWPVWLQSRGLSPELTGVALGLSAWARLVVNPILGSYADRKGDARGMAMLLAASVLASYVAFSFAHGTAALLVLSLVLGVAFAPLVPLIDASAVAAANNGGVDYGRVRRWGSAAFIAGSLGVGWLLEGAPQDAILFTLMIASAVLIGAMALLPRRARPPKTKSRLGVRQLLGRPEFRLFLLTCAALHGSHAVLYAYGTQHWRAAGIGDATIGGLWATGVVAEIVLFSFAPGVATRLSPATMLTIAGVGGLLRWPVLALTTSLPWLFAAQLLHAITFAATHLGAMSMIREHVGEDATATATALYSGVATGLAFGIGLPLAGVLYTRIAGEAYFVMAGVSATGIFAAFVLRARLRHLARARHE